MTYRPKPKYASKDAQRGPWSSCDRCGFQWNLSDLQWQYNYQGGSTPQNLRMLHCPRCIDDLGYQQKLIVLPPDPSPIFNTRPENYVVDESNWMTTQSGVTIDTETGSKITTNIPNPYDNANTAILNAMLSYHLGSVAVAYLDFFNGSPRAGGVSVLSAMTGSSVRPNIASQLQVTSKNIAVNTNVLTVTSSATSITNVGFVAIFDAASGGTLLVSGPVSASKPSIIAGAAVQFNALGLSINLA